QMYDSQAIERLERKYGHIDTPKPYHRPPFYSLAIAPLALLPYGWAFAIWQAINLLALFAFWRLWPAKDRFHMIVLSLWFTPLWSAFGLAQDTTVLLALVGLAGRLLQRRNPMLAGVVLAMCAFKANLLLALPVMVLARRMWRVALGAALTGVVLYLVSAI